MTTNQTIDGVPGLRDLLERVATEANHMLGFTYSANYDECRAAVDELRALLDAPAESCGACNSCTNGCRLDAESPPSHPQGERASTEVTISRGMSSGSGFDLVVQDFGILKLKMLGNDECRVVFEHREQPAPVAVVLPEQLIAAIEAEQERLSQEDYLMDSEDCVKVVREEVTRLNTK